MAMPKATPKARLFQIFPCGKGLTFDTESVPNPPSEDAVPGTTSFFKTNHAITFRCTLRLPDGSKVISDLFPRKKDAEHNASQLALDQMREALAPTLDVLSVEEKWENLRRRIQETFSDKNVLSYLPLREHFRVAVRRQGFRYGHVPIAAIVALDAKINTLCKVIDRKSETDPVYAVSMLCKAASTCTSVNFDSETLCISRIEPFKPEVEQELLQRKQEGSTEVSDSMTRELDSPLIFRAVLIPSSVDRAVCSSQIVVEPEEYYMDVLAERIGLQEGCRLAMSRPIGKIHPAVRLYWAIPKHLPNVQSPLSDLVYLTGEDQNIAADHEDLRRYSTKQQGSQLTNSRKNVRASLLMGYPVYGDVLLAAVGCDWRSIKVYSLDVSLSFYYRSLLGRFPQGNYKVNRGAVMVSNLPLSFSSRLQWRGMSPRGLLIEFCQQHRLPDPVFVLSCTGSESRGPIDLDGKIPELAEVAELDEANGNRGAETEKNGEDGHTSTGHSGPFFCTVRVEFQRGSVIEYESGGPYRNRHDAIQSCGLKALHSCRPWFESILTGSYEPILPDCRTSTDVDEDLMKAENDEVRINGPGWCLEPSNEDFFEVESGVESSQVELTPPPGAMVTIRYTVRWCRDGDLQVEPSNTYLEKQKEFSFELGIGAVIGRLDSMVAEMPVGQITCFFSSLPASPLLFAAGDDARREDGLPEPATGKLKYTVQLLKFVEPPEERMEAALFKPSLSKQRLGCALSIIQKLQAKSLIDLGCGSGSLMEQLLEEPTGLVELVGLDISPKSLVRAAKVLSAKLMEDQPGKDELDTIKLYEGSISEFNPELQGIDVAVCIEVVEHMDPGPLSMFGITILGKLKPKVLIVSTPNFEYNPILQRLEWDPTTNSLKSSHYTVDNSVQDRARTGSHPHSTLGSMEKRIRLSDGKDCATTNGSSNGRVAQQAVKFRNEDHRFEWTRAEFRDWASKQARAYEYDVTFDGVGGSGEEDGPGYASQIAIFTRRPSSPLEVEHPAKRSSNGDTHSDGHGENPHKIVWQWMPVEQRDFN